MASGLLGYNSARIKTPYSAQSCKGASSRYGALTKIPYFSKLSEITFASYPSHRISFVSTVADFDCREYYRYTPSQADVTVYKAIQSSAPTSQYPHAARWFKHIATYEAQHPELPGDSSKDADSLIPAVASTSSAPAAKAAAADDDDDEVDLFGSDDEEADAEAERIKAERLAEYAAKKAKKPATIAKVCTYCITICLRMPTYLPILPFL